MPTAWDVNLYLVADDPLLTTNIAFCKSGTYYYLCNSRIQKNPNLKPETAYFQLIDTAAYSIRVEE
jgi:hypothetical protein